MIQKKTQTGLRLIPGGTSGSGTLNGQSQRKCQSWIDQFVKYTDNLESPHVFRRWAAIATIAAALEQRVWITTSDRLYPNLYVALIGHPGVGKSRTIGKARAFLKELEDHHVGPTDMTDAALVDALVASVRRITHYFPTQFQDEFHSLTLMFDEWGTMLKEFKGAIIPLLTSFYDVTTPYEHWRRHKDTRIIIPRPQLNILAGSTPSNIIQFMPDYAWDQGFTSRLILVFSSERNFRDDFAGVTDEIPPELAHDIRSIFLLEGEFKITEEYRQLVNDWRSKDEKPKPTHPKLIHYNARRKTHLYKLSMVSSVDRGNDLIITADDFHKARRWLEDVEVLMPDVFTAGSISVDGRAMDEICEFISKQGKPVTEHRILRYASNLLPANSIIKVLHIMQASRRLTQVGDDPITYVVGEQDPTAS